MRVSIGWLMGKKDRRRRRRRRREAARATTRRDEAIREERLGGKVRVADGRCRLRKLDVAPAEACAPLRRIPGRVRVAGRPGAKCTRLSTYDTHALTIYHYSLLAFLLAPPIDYSVNRYYNRSTFYPSLRRGRKIFPDSCCFSR